MKKSEITKLDDKDLQLRYYLGGLNLINDGKNQLCNYWACHINCSCDAIPYDDRIIKVKSFINKHNITNEGFIKLSYWLLTGAVMKYKGMYSPLFIELEEVLEQYNFTHTKMREIPDNDFRERELENIVNDSIVKEYCTKYHLDVNDFIILAKMSINYHFYRLQVASNPDDVFANEIYKIISHYELYVPREYIEEYREIYKEYQEKTKLVIDARIAQKNYLKLLKELQATNPILVTKLISNELSELGLNSRKEIMKLMLQKR